MINIFKFCPVSLYNGACIFSRIHVSCLHPHTPRYSTFYASKYVLKVFVMVYLSFRIVCGS